MATKTHKVGKRVVRILLLSCYRAQHSFTGACHSVHGGGADTPRRPLQWTVCILLGCILIKICFQILPNNEKHCCRKFQTYLTEHCNVGYRVRGLLWGRYLEDIRLSNRPFWKKIVWIISWSTLNKFACNHHNKACLLIGKMIAEGKKPSSINIKHNMYLQNIWDSGSSSFTRT